MTRLYFLTSRKEKFEEVKSIFPQVEQLDIDLPEIQNIDSREVIKYKLREAKKHYQGGFIVEDTSLNLACLNGLPGPPIKWFLKTIGNKGLFEISKSFDNDKAEAKVVIGYSDVKGKISFFEGIIKGKIVSPKGDRGFGWDPIFQPDGHLKTFGEMTSKEKNKISMRRIALNKLKKFLKK